MLEKLQNIDRRILYAVMVVVITVIMLNPVGLAIVPSAETKKAYDTVAAMPAGSILFVGCDFDPAASAELLPAMKALLRQAFANNVRVVLGSMWTLGGTVIRQGLDAVTPEFPNLKYGVDYVNLGYKPGNDVLLRSMVESVVTACAGTDGTGKQLSNLPLIANDFQSLSKANVIFCFSSGTPGWKDYIRHVTTTYKDIPLIVSCTAVSAPELMPMLQSGQVTALVNGQVGAADYEVLTNKPGSASLGSDMQAFTQGTIILFVLVGNICYFASKSKGHPASRAN